MKQETLASWALGTAVVAVALAAWMLGPTGPSHGSAMISPGVEDGGHRGPPIPEDYSSETERAEIVLRSETPSAAILAVLVTDEQRKPLDGAFVAAESVARAELMGYTDKHGLLELPRDGISGNWISASANGFVPAALPVPPLAEDSLEFVLHSAGRIEGRVRWSDGNPVGSGYHVYDVPGRIGDDTYRKVLHGCIRPGIRTTRTNAEGEFVLDGLEIDRPVKVFAAGAGGWMRGAVAAKPGDVLDLVVEPIYGIRVHLVEEGGRALRTSSRLRGYSRSWWSDDPRIESCNYELDCTFRAIISPEWMAGVWRHVGDDHLLLMFRGRGDADAVGPAPSFVEPVFVSVAIAGYEAKRVETRAMRLDGEVFDLDLELHPLAEGWGVLDVHIDGALEGAFHSQRPRVGKKLGALYLTELSTGNTVIASVRYPIEDPLRLDGVPYGHYDVYLLTDVGGTRVPPYGHPLRVEIGPEPTECHLLLSGYGGIEVELSLPDGSPYEGAVTFMVMSEIREEEFTGEEVFFERGPYLIEGLGPNEYKVRVQALGKETLEPPFTEGDVCVIAEEVSRCRITLPD